MFVSSEAGAYSAGSGEPGLPPGKVRVEENSTGLIKVGRGSEIQRTGREHCKHLKGFFLGVFGSGMLAGVAAAPEYPSRVGGRGQAGPSGVSWHYLLNAFNCNRMA